MWIKRRFAYKNGRRLAVLRPLDPALALRLVAEARALPEAAQSDAFRAVITKQAYRFVGFLSSSSKPDVLDKYKRVVGTPEMGDSFVNEDDLATFVPVEEGEST